LDAVKIVASFYKVQYEHKRLRGGALCIHVCAFYKFPEVCFCQEELAKLDDI